MKKYWEVKMVSDKVGELLLYGEISSTAFWGDEVSPKQVDADLKALGDLDQLNVRINSPGGSVFAGMAIYNIIKRHPAPTKCAYIDGLAASMATIIPFSCGKIIMPSNALQMIHKPMIRASGNTNDLQKAIDMLNKVEDQMVGVYSEKTGMDADKIKELLAAETWMTAQEALDMGFIHEIEEDSTIAACLDGDFLVIGEMKADIKSFKNFPETYRAALPLLEPVVDKKEPPEDKTDDQKLLLKEQNDRFRELRAKIITYEEDK